MARYKLNEKFLIFEGKLEKLWLIPELVRLCPNFRVIEMYFILEGFIFYSPASVFIPL